jgi:hypothetical protein
MRILFERAQIRAQKKIKGDTWHTPSTAPSQEDHRAAATPLPLP